MRRTRAAGRYSRTVSCGVISRDRCLHWDEEGFLVHWWSAGWLGGCTHIHLTRRGFIIADGYHIMRRFVIKAGGRLGKFLLNCLPSQQMGTCQSRVDFLSNILVLLLQGCENEQHTSDDKRKSKERDCRVKFPPAISGLQPPKPSFPLLSCRWCFPLQPAARTKKRAEDPCRF